MDKPNDEEQKEREQGSDIPYKRYIRPEQVYREGTGDISKIHNQHKQDRREPRWRLLRHR